MVDEKTEVSKEVKSEVKPEVKEERYNIVEVTTETGLAIQDSETKKILNQLDLIVEISNKVDKLVKGLV